MENYAKFIAADVMHLPWKDSFFDSVVTAHTLEHIINLAAAMAEIRRGRKAPYCYSHPMPEV
jgi:ubiquinone/menaquinone biosynthesis C-methylase UbiE